ncbi:MAG: hypothetical protein NTX45_14805 [Proteobacteria bacterium]|nr:hypothetical protein [Pseudomonadota bacterium]
MSSRIAAIAFLKHACILLLALARLVAKTLKRFIPSRRTKRVRRMMACSVAVAVFAFIGLQ